MKTTYHRYWHEFRSVSYLVWGVVLCLAGCQSAPGIPAKISPEAWEQARVQNNRRVLELVEQARAARRAGKHESARNLLKEAVALDPAQGSAQHALGVVYFEQGDLYNAAVHLDVASRLLSDRYEPCYNLGRVLEAGGQYDQAIEQYQRSLARRLDHLETLENLARVRLKAGYQDADTLRLLVRCAERERRPEWSEWIEQQTIRLRVRLERGEAYVSNTEINPVEPPRRGADAVVARE